MWRAPQSWSPLDTPCLFSVALDGHTIQRVTKSGLKAMKAEINQALKDSK